MIKRILRWTGIIIGSILILLTITVSLRQNLKFEAEPDQAKRRALIDAAEKNGTRPKPEFGSVWYHMVGKTKETARTHKTIAVPGATAASMGLPDNAKQGGVWIMDAGTSAAHLMIPGD